MSPLQRAIYSTVAYRDLFHYPVTLTEIHRYLHGMRCAPAEISAALAAGFLEFDGEFFALPGRSEIFAVRRKRRIASQNCQKMALGMARFLATLPNIRMVAMTGSLAAGNLDEDGDVDFLLVTDGGTLWRTRALCRLLALLDGKLRKGLFCPNTFLSAAALPLARRSLYDAQELCQMIPLYGLEAYAQVRAANGWTEQYLPNAEGPPPGARDCQPFSQPLKKLAEWLLDGAAGRALENFEAERKIHRFNETDHLKGAWTRSTRESHSMWDNMRLRIEEAWTERLRALDR